MFRLFLPVLVLVADAQNYGDGFGKTTYSVSDGMGSYNWLSTYFPIDQDYPFGDWQCGELGRGRIKTDGNGFGMHCVQLNSSSARIHKAEGCPAIADIERKLDSKWSKVTDGGAYDPFLDYNGGYWVSSLDPYITKFTASKVPVLKLSWKDTANSKTYYSIIVRVHNSMMLVELMSGDCSSCSSALAVPTARFVFAAGQSPQDLWGSLNDKTSQKPMMHPARLSWPSSDVSRERKFFTGLLVDLVGKKQAEGVQTDIYDFSPLMPVAKTMQFHVVQRADDGSAFTWKDYEAAVMKCHKATIKDDLCGENAFMDNHVGFAQSGTSTKTLDAGIVKKLSTDLGLPFHATPSPRGPLAIYAMAGNGLTLTLQIGQGSYTPPRTGSVGMLNLCSDGNCAGPSPTPPGPTPPSPPSPTPPSPPSPTPPSPTPPSPPSPTPPSPPSPTPPSPPASSCNEAIEKECGDYVGQPAQCMQCVNNSPKRPEMLAACGLYRNMRTACGYPDSLVV